MFSLRRDFKNEKLGWKCGREGCTAHGVGDTSMFKHSDNYGHAMFQEAKG